MSQILKEHTSSGDDHLIRVNGIELAYQCSGLASDPAVLLVQGLCKCSAGCSPP